MRELTTSPRLIEEVKLTANQKMRETEVELRHPKASQPVGRGQRGGVILSRYLPSIPNRIGGGRIEKQQAVDEENKKADVRTEKEEKLDLTKWVR